MKKTIPLHDGVAIAYHDIGPQERVPRLALVAGVNGKELNGLFVLSRLAAYLNEVNDGKRPGQRLYERILIVPVANQVQADNAELGYATGIVDTDVAGEDDSPLATHIITEAVLSITHQAYYRVEIHTPEPAIEEMPQLRLYTPNDDERATACLFGLPAVIERPAHALTPLNLAWQRWGGENFVIKSGQADILQISHCEVVFRTLLGFLNRTAMIGGITLSEEEDDLHYFTRDQTFTLLSEHAGLFASPQEVGHWIQAGDHLGYIYDSFQGDIGTEVRSPVSGLLSTLRRHPLLAGGDLMARILLPGSATTGKS